MCTAKTATEDKCDSSWAYLSSYIYITSPSHNLKTPGAKTLPLSANYQTKPLSKR